MQITCPSCKYILDTHQASDISKNTVAPSMNDYSLCFYCGAINRFDSALKLRPVTPEELVELNDIDPDLFDTVIKGQVAIREFIKAEEYLKANSKS